MQQTCYNLRVYVCVIQQNNFCKLYSMKQPQTFIIVYLFLL